MKQDLNKAKGGPERDVVLGHADECDGIEEYDNALPGWWLGIFYFTLVWGVVYTIHYHFVGGRSQESEYEAELAAANVRWPPPKVEGVDLSPASIEEGKGIFTTTCISCHGLELQGGIGPNLVDATWIHGGSPEQILKSISEGVAAKGMPGWGPVLGPVKTARVAAYVYDAAQKAAAAAPPAPATEGAAPAADGAAPAAVTPDAPEGSTGKDGG